MFKSNEASQTFKENNVKTNHIIINCKLIMFDIDIYYTFDIAYHPMLKLIQFHNIFLTNKISPHDHNL